MRLGPYELVRQIGAGGMGEVWIAHRRLPGAGREAVAIKRLPRRLAGDPNYRRILLDEARLSRLLYHPNIIHTIEAGEADGEVFIAMELVDGLDLSRINKLMMARGERVSVAVAAYVTAELLRGLAYAHNLEHEGELISLIHRDVSPHNVMLSAFGGVKLADFGVARLSSEDTSGTHVKGKARYMPPEQLRGDSRSPAVDLFAVGAILQELLDGALFRGDAIDDARLLGMAIDGVVPPPRRPLEIPPELELLRRSLLAADPESRPRSADKALELLLRWPGYRPQPEQVAKLVERLRLVEAELGGGASQTGLGIAHQATFLHTNELEVEGSDMAELAALVEAPDRVLLELADEPSERRLVPLAARDDHTAATRGDRSELEQTQGSDPATTGGHPTPPRDPSLALDLAGQSFARHVPTSPNPTLPERRPLWPIAAGVALALGAGVAGAWALGLLDPTDDPPKVPETTLRQARVVGRGSLLDLGLRDRGMDKLLVDDIRFDYQPDRTKDPLAQLARGEAEFALTSLDAFIDAGEPGKVVALIGAPLATAALILDAPDHPGLRSLAELESPAAIACTPITHGFARRLDEALAVEFTTTLLADDAAVFAELERDDSELAAAVVREPWIAKAEAAGMLVAASGRDLPLADVEVLVASAAVLEADPALVETVVTHYYASVRAQPGGRADELDRVAAAHGLSLAEAERTLAGLCLFDEAGAAEAAADPALAPRLRDRVDPRFVAAQPDAPAGALAACLGARSRSSQRQPLGPLTELASSPFEPQTASFAADAPALIEALAAELRAFNPNTVSAELIGFGEHKGSAGRKLGSARAQALLDALREAEVALPMRSSGVDGRDPPPGRVQIILSRAP